MVLGHLSRLIFYKLYDLTHRISSRYCLYFKNLLIFQVDSMIRVSSGMCKVEMACVLYDHTSQGARDFARKTGECMRRWAHSNTLALSRSLTGYTFESFKVRQESMWRELIEDNCTKSLRCLIDGATLHGTEDAMCLLQRCEVLVAFWNQVSMESLSHQIMSKVTTVQYRFCQNPWHFESLFCSCFLS
jgi:hypothetical protein